MRTRKNDLVSDDSKPFIGKLIKEYREKYNYSLEDLSKALGHKKIGKLYINMKTVL